MKNGLRLILLGFVAMLFAGSFLPSSRAQVRPIFSHNTKAHKEGKYKDCSACHELPTQNWTSPRRDKQEPYPDVVNFPYKKHMTCNGCHSSGAKPDMYRDRVGFCGSCHFGSPSPGNPSVIPFPRHDHPSQFTTLFPHNTHQDIIALNRPMRTDFAVAHFIPAVFTLPDDKAKPTFYNCTICHETDAKMPKNAARKLLSPPEVLKPLSDIVPDTFERPITAEFFKDSPKGHASCFTCHYQFQNLPDGKQNCSGCHEMTPPYFEKTIIRRYSLKFDHQRPGHVEKDCASCHIRITQNGDVRTMKDADVPILSCKQCHATQEDAPWQHVLTTELDAREASITNKQAPFQCTYCHTSAIGRYDIPTTHRKQ